MPTYGEWTAAWKMLGVLPPERVVFDQLVAAYSSFGRAYHNLRHLEECFDSYDLVRDRLQRPAEVSLALWFHDAVYDSRRSDNEVLSADWADRVLQASGCRDGAIQRIRALILSTTHRSVPRLGDEAFLVDIDLTILGAAPERFAEYEAQIREEYGWVDAVAFAAGRADFLERMLDRPAIYANPDFYDRFEQAARRNLARSIADHRQAAREG